MKPALLFLALLALGLPALRAQEAAVPPARVPVAKTVTLTVTSDGTPPLVYQWFKDGVALKDAIAGAFSDKLVLTNFAPEHAGIYHATTANEAGSTTSNKVQLTPVKQPTRSTITVNIAVGTVNP